MTSVRLTIVCILSAAVEATDKKNVLMLVADDLRPQLNKAYGQSQMVTPNLDKLASTSLVFDRAYTNFAICSASRNSFMTGRLPDKTRVWNFINYFRQSGLSARNGSTGQEWLSMPEFFKQHGYVVLGHGKMYHPGKPPNNDEPRSWTQEQDYVPLSTTGCPHGERFCPDVGKGGRTDDSDFSDYNTTLAALRTLRKWRPHGSTPQAAVSGHQAVCDACGLLCAGMVTAQSLGSSRLASTFLTSRGVAAARLERPARRLRPMRSTNVWASQ